MLCRVFISTVVVIHIPPGKYVVDDAKIIWLPLGERELDNTDQRSTNNVSALEYLGHQVGIDYMSEV